MVDRFAQKYMVIYSFWVPRMAASRRPDRAIHGDPKLDFSSRVTFEVPACILICFLRGFLFRDAYGPVFYEVRWLEIAFRLHETPPTPADLRILRVKMA